MRISEQCPTATNRRCDLLQCGIFNQDLLDSEGSMQGYFAAYSVLAEIHIAA